MAFDLDAVEQAIVQTAVTDTAELTPDLRGMLPNPHEALSQGDHDEQPLGEFAADPEQPTADLMSESDFIESMWEPLHDMAGGMVEARTGYPCPLGDQSRSSGGVQAGQALYKMCRSNPALSRMILSTQSTFIGQVMVVGLHGFACVQCVRSSVDAANENQRAAAFKSVRPEQEDVA